MLDKEAHEQLPSVTSSTHMDLKASGILLTYQINKGVGRFPEGLTTSPHRLGVWETC